MIGDSILNLSLTKSHDTFMQRLQDVAGLFEKRGWPRFKLRTQPNDDVDTVRNIDDEPQTVSDKSYT